MQKKLMNVMAKQEERSGWRSGKDLGAEDLTRGDRSPRKKNEASRARARLQVPVLYVQ